MNMTDKNLSLSETQTLLLRINLSIVLIAISLPVFMIAGRPISMQMKSFRPFTKLEVSEVSDRLTVIILFAVCSLMLIMYRKITSERIPPWFQISLGLLASLLLLGSFSWRSGDQFYEALGSKMWFGWGDKLGLLLLISASIALTLAQKIKQDLSQAKPENFLVLNTTALLVFALFYLPSFVQTFNGLIELHHSRYILNDFLIQASGHWPYSDVMPQYVSVLGWPLKLIAAVSPKLAVDSALLWVNVLVILEVAMFAWITRSVLGLRSWATSLLIPISVIFIKVQPNDQLWGSIAQHINLVPARTVLPIFLLVCLLKIGNSNSKRLSSLTEILTGIVLTFCAFNNLEFGLPAAISAIIICFGLWIRKDLSARGLTRISISALASAFAVVFVYVASGNQISFSTWSTMIRVHGFDGYMNIPMPDFGLWIFFYAVLGTSTIIGIMMIFFPHANRSLRGIDRKSGVLFAFSGIWGSMTLIYFTGRSLVPEIVVFLIPLSLSLVGFISIVKFIFINLEIQKLPKGALIDFLPITLLVFVPLISVFSAPSPSFEWRRVWGHGETWSAKTLESTAGFQEAIHLVERNSDLRFLYLGNNGPAIELLSGIENGLGIISLEDSTINPLMNEVACRVIDRSSADRVIAPKSDWPDDWAYNDPPCSRLKLIEFSDESDLLIFEIVTEE